MPGPIGRSKHPTLWQLLPRKFITICCVQVHSVACIQLSALALKAQQESEFVLLAPPVRKDSPRIRDAKEDNDG
jgi:hypothetical protein